VTGYKITDLGPLIKFYVCLTEALGHDETVVRVLDMEANLVR
jgi:hypothetical protein